MPRLYPWSFASRREWHAPCVHHACNMHLFHLANLGATIVLLCSRPVRCYVAELVPHFTLNAVDYIVHVIAQQHNVIALGSS